VGWHFVSLIKIQLTFGPIQRNTAKFDVRKVNQYLGSTFSISQLIFVLFKRFTRKFNANVMLKRVWAQNHSFVEEKYTGSP
jgi:hypothetical protein